MNNSETDSSSNVAHGPVTSHGALPEEIETGGEDGEQSQFIARGCEHIQTCLDASFGFLS